MNTSFKLIVSALLACSFWSKPALSQIVSDPTKVLSGTYSFDRDHTQVSFSVLHFGFTHYSGIFSGITGSVSLDTQEMQNTKMSVDIPTASVMTTSPKLNDELKGKEWFNSEQFPKAHFDSTKILRTSDNTATVEGNLTLRGVTKPETLKVHFIGAGVNMMSKKYTAGFEATAVIKRSDFGVKMFVPYVEDDVELRISGALEKDQ